MAGEKIMIVDDEAVVHELLTHYLEREGFRVFSVYSGSHVLEKTAFHKPDLILLDILLPGLDGLEICHELRKKSEVPIIFITSRDAPHEVALGLGIGGDDYVKKPFNPVEVVARVRAQLCAASGISANRGRTGAMCLRLATCASTCSTVPWRWKGNGWILPSRSMTCFFFWPKTPTGTSVPTN